ncbi:MAG TPA: cation:proton antiporter [Polyangiaceae bacterium]|nr:cation:proton antiporter [Polyangiaceae bacterium]
MTSALELLYDLALMLCLAAATGALFERLKQPVILGQLLAGAVLGPHVPIPVFANVERMHTLSEIGVILVMFCVGLEFSLTRLARVLPSAGPVALIQLATLTTLGYTTAALLGWNADTCVFAAAMVAISSTMVVAKVFGTRGVEPKLSEVVFGLLVVQDLAAVLMLAMLTAFASSGTTSGAALMSTAGQLAAFLLGTAALGFWLVPRLFRLIARLESSETLLLASTGLCIALSLLAHRVGYSVALGAFLAGSLVAESGEGEKVEHLVRPMRDLFAAIFFVSIGSMLDPRVLLEHWASILAIVAVVTVGQIASVSLGVFLTGNSVRTSVRAAMSVAQIGEFSFIIVGVGVSGGKVPPFIYSVAIAAAVMTTLSSPWLIANSERVALWLDRHLPRPVHAFVEVYGSWFERARRNQSTAPATRLRGALLWLFANTALLALVAVGLVVAQKRLAQGVQHATQLALDDARLLVTLGSIALIAPLAFGIVRVARRIGRELVQLILPGTEAPAARAAVAVTSQLAVCVFVGAPLVSFTQPFLPRASGAFVAAVALLVVVVAFWRSWSRVEAELRAGTDAFGSLTPAGPERVSALDLERLVPGLGPLAPVALEAGSSAIGRSLSQINLRAISGASVIAVLRGGGVHRPDPHEPLREGDVLALAGSGSCIDSATALLGSADTSAALEMPA